MSLQWKRQAELIVGVDGQGLRVLSIPPTPSLRVKFEITKTLRASLNTATIRVYNLSPANRGKIKGEFDEVILNAGYLDQALLIFRGQIRTIADYPEAADRVIEINAADGERDTRKAIVNFTLAAGTTDDQLVDKMLESFGSTKKGHVRIKSKQRARGRVVSGAAMDVFAMLAAENDAHVSIQDGKLVIVPVDSTLPDEAIVIRADTGMLDSPEVDDKGVKVRCLLNPRIRCNGKILLDNEGIKFKIAKQKERQPGAKAPKKPPKRKVLARLDPDGVYKVYKVIHKGDTHGSEWVSEVYAVALAKTIPAGRQAA